MYSLYLYRFPLSVFFSNYLTLSLLNSVKSTSSIDLFQFFFNLHILFQINQVSINSYYLSIRTLLYIFPASFERYYIKPIITKNNIDTSVLTNVRPISQLFIISKILDKNVSKHIFKYPSVNNILDSNQSASKKHHSTVYGIYILTHVPSDLFTTLDDNQCIQMIL